MPSLEQIVAALRQYRRYPRMSAYVDDIDELRDGKLSQNQDVKLVRASTNPLYHLPVGEELLTVHLNSSRGLVQLRLIKPSQITTAVELTDATRAELETTVATMIATACLAKQGQLGTLVLCVMLGNHVTGAAGPVGMRILTIQHVENDSWRAYDGPLLAWAKEQLIHDPT
jgi:hypothetical protein